MVKNEFFALNLGLHGIPKQKPEGQSPPPGYWTLDAIQGRPGAQVALLQSPIPLTVVITHHKAAKQSAKKQTTLSITRALRTDMR